MLTGTTSAVVESDNVYGAVMVLRDVTEQRAKEKQYELLDRLASPRLDVAVFARCGLGNASVAAMVSEGVFERARRVDLSGNVFTQRGLDVLARQQMPALERLRVWPSTKLSRAQAEAFADLPIWGEEVRDEMWADLEGEGEAWGT